MGFELDVRKFAEKVGLRGDLVMRKAGFEVFDQVLLFSPVRSGRYRASHRIAVNRVDTSVAPPGQHGGVQGTPASGAERASALSKVAKAGLEDFIAISQSLPYGPRIEEGWSQQAPGGVYGPAFDYIQSQFDQIAKRAVSEVP